MNKKMKVKRQKEIVECLSCGANIFVGSKIRIGTTVECGRCDSIFEVIDLDPMSIDWLYDDEYEDETYFDEDDESDDPYDDYDESDDFDFP